MEAPYCGGGYDVPNQFIPFFVPRFTSGGVKLIAKCTRERYKKHFIYIMNDNVSSYNQELIVHSGERSSHAVGSSECGPSPYTRAVFLKYSEVVSLSFG